MLHKECIKIYSQKSFEKLTGKLFLSQFKKLDIVPQPAYRRQKASYKSFISYKTLSKLLCRKVFFCSISHFQFEQTRNLFRSKFTGTSFLFNSNKLLRKLRSNLEPYH